MDELKEIGRDLWKNKPLLITVVVGVSIVAFILVRNSFSSAQQAASGSGSTALPASAGGTYVEESYNNYQNTSTVTNQQTGLPVGVPQIFPPNTNPVTHNPGTTFLGPSGVKHYVAKGGETLTQIASHFGLTSWNSVYAIPDNQKLFGRLPASKARVYAPKAGQVISLPGNTVIGF